MKIGILTFAKRKYIDSQVAKIDTDEVQAVLSRPTFIKIQTGKPVSYRSAAIYCKALGLDPEEIILKQRRIPILEPIVEETPA